MKILFTGASSFTGMWFARELAQAGHEVVAPLLRCRDEYSGIRQERIELLQDLCHLEEGAPFGSERFLDIIAHNGPWDLFCHHAADVSNYKSADFDYLAALQRNTHNLPTVLKTLRCPRVILTGSVFERGEGFGSDELPTFSPYGLSKTLTSEVFQYACYAQEIALGKFVIPNPFGPYEEERFTTYLAKSWLQREKPTVKYPRYVRDNIHVSLLARAYCYYAEENPSTHFNPSGYVEEQGIFVKRFATEMEKRLDVLCPVVLENQTDFPEPQRRTNNIPVDSMLREWDSTQAWDELAQFYLKHYA